MSNKMQDKLSFADKLLEALCLTLDCCKDAETPGLALISRTESLSFWESPTKFEITACLLLFTLFGKQMYTKYSATELRFKLSAINGGIWFR